MQRLTKAEVTALLEKNCPQTEKNTLYRRQTHGEVEKCFPTRRSCMRFVRRYQSRLANNTMQHGVYFIRQINTTPIGVRRKLATWCKNNSSRFKFKLERGYLLRKTRDEDKKRCWKYFYESANTRLKLPEIELPSGWVHVNTKSEMKTLLDKLGKSYLSVTETPDTSWSIPRNNCVTTTMHIIPLNESRFGNGFFPENWQGIHPMTIRSKDTLCFFRCVAVFQMLKNGMKCQGVEKETKKLFQKFKKYKNTRGIKKKIENYAGTQFHDIERYSKENKLSFVVYSKVEKDRKVEFRCGDYTNTVHIAIYQQHMGLITDMERFAQTYLCKRCSKCFAEKKWLTRHMKTCKHGQASCYGVAKGENELAFLKWEKSRVKLCKKHKINKLGFICGDFETYHKLQEDKRRNTVFKSKHHIASHAMGYHLENVEKTETHCQLRKQHETEREFLIRVIKQYLEYWKIIVRHRLCRYHTTLRNLLKSGDKKLRYEYFQLMKELLCVNVWYYNFGPL